MLAMARNISSDRNNLSIAVLLLFLATAHAQKADGDSAATPISVTPAQNFEGDDGQWNSFYLTLGTPEQFVRVFPSTSSWQTLVVQPLGCGTTKSETCFESRGGVFDFNKSSSWDDNGLWVVKVGQDLGYVANANYGFDNVALGGTPAGFEGPVVKNVTVGALAVYDYYLGLFPLSPKPSNFTGFENPVPSYMERLRSEGLIPSTSYGYTAGKHYDGGSGVLASLTLGGYDSSRMQSPSVSFDFGTDSSRNLLVAIQSINLSDNDRSDMSLLPTSIYANIDSTTAQIWLPQQACDAFETAFSLTYDSDTDLYFIDQDAQRRNSARNASVTFTLGQGPTSEEAVKITFPYSAFVQTVSPPYPKVSKPTQYFPLRRSKDESQYVLGRLFLQEAFLTVDYDRANFSLSQSVYETGKSVTIVPILPPGSDEVESESTAAKGLLSTGAIIGIGAGGGAAVIILCIVGIIFCLRRHKRRRRQVAELEEQNSRFRQSLKQQTTLDGNVETFNKVELDAIGTTSVHQIDGRDSLLKHSDSVHVAYTDSPLVEADAANMTTPVFEMLADVPDEDHQLGQHTPRRERSQAYNSASTTIPASPTLTHMSSPTTLNSPDSAIVPPLNVPGARMYSRTSIAQSRSSRQQSFAQQQTVDEDEAASVGFAADSPLLSRVSSSSRHHLSLESPPQGQSLPVSPMDQLAARRHGSRDLSSTGVSPEASHSRDAWI